VIEELSSEDRVWDLCVVGTGPVGMAMALEFERLGREVLVLESGGTEAAAATTEASRAVILTPKTHAPMAETVHRALGGASWTWGGRCVPYDDVDFARRDFVADAHWPFGHDEIRPWYTPAAEFMVSGSDKFTAPYKQKLGHDLTFDCLERWVRQREVILVHREHLLASPQIKLSLNSTVTDLNLSADGERVESLSVAMPGGVRTVKARRIVLAMGGVETTRLLLHVQQRWPDHFGGADGALGRYYMGHLAGILANIHFDKRPAFDDLDFSVDEYGTYRRRRLVLTEEAQLRNKVLNTVFWPDNPYFQDPSHRNGAISFVYLTLAFRPLGKRFISEGIRKALTGTEEVQWGAHIRNVLLGGPRAARDLYRILRDRFLRSPKKPGFLVESATNSYPLKYHAEQIPTRDSRITIGDETDDFGLPRAVIDFRYADQDIDSVVRSHTLLDEALRANGLGRLEYLYPPEKLAEKAFAQAADGYHQVGTTRMGTDPAASVVDPDLKVHGVENLFVASSSVFPTSGQANSTFLAVAFGIRLAHHLSK